MGARMRSRLRRPSSRAREARAMLVRVAARYGVPLTIADVEITEVRRISADRTRSKTKAQA
jgi:hypothetical protein